VLIRIKPKIRKSEEPPKDKIEILDFSKAAIQRAVSAEITQHPVTIYSGVGALISGLYMALINFSPGSFLLCIGLSLFCAASFVFNKSFLQQNYEMKYVEKLRESMRILRERAVHKLEQDLRRFECPEGVEQIDSLREKYESLVSVIERKVPEEGLVHSRFLGMAEQVYKNGLDNLQQVVVCLDSISPIDPKTVERKIRELKARVGVNPSLQKSIDLLSNTLEMRKSRILEVENLLSENITAMAQLDQTAMEISQMDFAKDKQATIDLENTLVELVHLRKTFKDYKIDS